VIDDPTLRGAVLAIFQGKGEVARAYVALIEEAL
jgi:ABC-type arginine transport system permease subunit